MTKHLLTAALLAASMPALAAPFLVADEYPAGVLSGATVTVNDAPSPIPCVIVTTITGAFPRCDLASLAPGGVYTLRMSVTGTPKCQSTPAVSGTCVAVASDLSAPFVVSMTGKLTTAQPAFEP